MTRLLSLTVILSLAAVRAEAQMFLPHRAPVPTATGPTLSYPNYVLMFNGRATTGAGLYSLGLAYSGDRGGTWTDFDGNPVIAQGSAGTFEANGCFHPTLAWDGSQYVSYYVGWDATYRKIGRATSPDLSVWSKYASNPVLDKGSAGAFDSYGASTPFVLFNTNETHAWQMWYSGRTNAYDTNTTIGYAYSDDGLAWTKFGKVLDLGTAGDFDDAGMASGCVTKIGSTYYLHYSGYHASLYHSGYATFTNPTNAYTKHGAFSGFDGTISFGGTNYYSNFIRSLVNRGDLWQTYLTLFHTNSSGIEGPEFSVSSTTSDITSPSASFTGPILSLGSGWHAESAENPAIIPVPVANTPVFPAPLVWYKFNEGSGTNLADASANGASGWVKGGTWVAGPGGGSNGALKFNGSSDYARSSNNITFGTNIITVCSWVYWDTIDNSTRVMFASSDANASKTNWFAEYTVEVAAKVYSAIYGRNTGSWKSRIETFTSVLTGQWYHVAIVYDNSTTAGAVKFYLNGTQRTLTLNTNLKDVSGNFSTDILWMGSMGLASYSAVRLDDLRIYPGELGPGQIYHVFKDPQ